jgi:hypothetical protein
MWLTHKTKQGFRDTVTLASQEWCESDLDFEELISTGI